MAVDWTQIAWPAALVAATLTASMIRDWISTARAAKEKVSGKDRLAKALNIKDVALRQILQDPSLALGTVNVDTIDINVVMEALATHAKLLNNAENALEAAAARLEILEHGTDTQAIESAQQELQQRQKNLVALQEMSDNLSLKVSSAARRIDIIRRTTQPEAVARRSARLADYLHQITTALSGKGTIDLGDVESEPDTASDARTDTLGEPAPGFTFVKHKEGYQFKDKELPAPEGNGFGTMPGLAPTIPRHKIAKPAEFDGNYAKYHSWAIAMIGYVQYMAVTFTEPLGVLLVFQAATVLGSPARRTMDALYLACMATDGSVRKEFDQLSTAMQTARWIGSKMDKVYFDHLAWDNAMDRLKKAHQGPLRSGSWLKFWQVIDEARNTLRLPDSEVKHYVINQMNQELLMEITIKAGWKRSQITLEYILNNAVAMEHLIIEKNRVHHSDEGMAGAYRKKREEKRAKRTPARAADFKSSEKATDAQGGTHQARRRLPEEDFAIVREAGVCFRCWQPGHTMTDCHGNMVMEMTNKWRQRLLNAASARGRAQGRQADLGPYDTRRGNAREEKKQAREAKISFVREGESRVDKADSSDEE